ncbi:hypothetical protein [Pseudonocardia xishanensis]|uniref:Uncharacterized protein n=1 Tax=Pseudonocardia xishanensis TaxID=630995 RepID=A0ABP8S1M8_9PSEU
MSTGDEGPRYYPNGPSSGQYAQYPQNPYASGAPQNPFPYTPYSQAPTPPAPPEPVRRPGTVVLGVVLLVVSALPFVVLGAMSLFVPLTQADIEAALPPDFNLAQTLTDAQITFDQLLQALRLIFALVTLLSLVYVALALTVLTGRRWARTVVTVLTVLFALFLVLNISASAAGLIVALPLVLSVAGVVLLYRRPSTEWLARL